MASGAHACPHITIETCLAEKEGQVHPSRTCCQDHSSPEVYVPDAHHSPSKPNVVGMADLIQEPWPMLSSSPGKESAFRVTSGRSSCFTALRSSTSRLERALVRGGGRGVICETGWYLGPLDTKLAPEHTSPPATEYKETAWD